MGAYPTIQACALTGHWTSDPSLSRLVLSPLSHTRQGHFCSFLALDCDFALFHAFVSGVFHCLWRYLFSDFYILTVYSYNPYSFISSKYVSYAIWLVLFYCSLFNAMHFLVFSMEICARIAFPASFCRTPSYTVFTKWLKTRLLTFWDLSTLVPSSTFVWTFLFFCFYCSYPVQFVSTSVSSQCGSLFGKGLWFVKFHEFIGPRCFIIISSVVLWSHCIHSILDLSKPSQFWLLFSDWSTVLSS